MHNILIYGGSFDPLHNGHLNTALAVQDHMHFERFVFLPCKTPVLKNATMASCDQRVCMLKLALQPYPTFSIDLREINRETPSFMVDTLKSFRDELGPTAAITLLIGMDAFLQLPRWHCWQTLLELCHLLVINRANINQLSSMPEPLNALLLAHETLEKNDLLQKPAGHIYRYNAGEYAISSTTLRQQIQQNKSIRTFVPKAIAQYIKAQALYQAL